MPTDRFHLRQFHRKQWRVRVVTMILGGIVAVPLSWMLSLPIVDWCLDRELLAGPDLAMFICNGLAFVVGAWTTWRLFFHELQPTACHRCKYDLSMNSTGTCPECGEHIPPYQQRLLQDPR